MKSNQNAILNHKNNNWGAKFIPGKLAASLLLSVLMAAAATDAVQAQCITPQTMPKQFLERY